MPFLRGILVQSIASAGLAFQDAYQIAQLIRNQLDESGEVTTIELQARVTSALRERFGDVVADTYEIQLNGVLQTTVLTASGGRPFSTTILTRSLEACAIAHEKALETARLVQETLVQDNLLEIDKLTLRQLVYRQLQEHLTQDAADRYLSWRQFKDSGEPLIVMVGGITGTGKSTVTNELAYPLNVVRAQSTDMLREIVRCYLGPEDVPSLSYSSFEAWKGLPTQQNHSEIKATVSPVIAGFMSQFNIVRSGLEATLARAVKERHDLIVDGIHVLPTELELESIRSNAVVVSVVLVVATRGMLASRLIDRGHQQPSRASSRYLEHLDAIWELQSHLVELAEAGDVDLIFNWEIEETVIDVLERVSTRICERYPPDESILHCADNG